LAVTRPIHSTSGIKLLDVGTTVDRRALEHLAGNTLAEPLDQCIGGADWVQRQDVISVAREQVAAVPLLGHFDAGLGEQSSRLWAALAACPLPPAFMLHLTVVRNSDQALYEHGARAAFIGLFIGVSAGFADADLQALATAALLHDVGMMHIDSAPPDGRSLTASERQALQRHTVIGQQIASSEPTLDPSIAIAIAQHHERIDGSGYPHGLRDAEIGLLPRVLMLVEIVSAVLDAPDSEPTRQLSMTLRANHQNLDPAFSQVLLSALPRPRLPVGADFSKHPSELRRVGALLAAWRIASTGASSAEAPQFAFVDERMQRLRRQVAEVRFDDGAATTAPEATSILCAEMNALGREALWQARQIAYDAVQRWPNVGHHETLAGQSAVSEWINATMRLTELPRSAGGAR